MRNKSFASNLSWIMGAVLFCGLISFTRIQTTAITGKVLPPAGVEKIIALQGSDSSTALPANTGDFVLKVKPGSWNVIVRAKPPYKDMEKDNVTVQEGKSVDLGEIRLEH
jgi:hypothetical protein